MSRPIIVLANGCFDILHAGHIEHLRQARSYGTKLIVSLTEDKYVKKGKGRPIYKWSDRAAVLRELRCVDEVIATRNAVNAILEVQPDVFVKGIDYADGKKFTEDVAATCKKVGTTLRYTDSPKQSATDAIRKTIECISL